MIGAKVDGFITTYYEFLQILPYEMQTRISSYLESDIRNQHLLSSASQHVQRHCSFGNRVDKETAMRKLISDLLAMQDVCDRRIQEIDALEEVLEVHSHNLTTSRASICSEGGNQGLLRLSRAAALSDIDGEMGKRSVGYVMDSQDGRNAYEDEKEGDHNGQSHHGGTVQSSRLRGDLSAKKSRMRLRDSGNDAVQNNAAVKWEQNGKPRRRKAPAGAQSGLGTNSVTGRNAKLATGARSNSAAGTHHDRVSGKFTSTATGSGAGVNSGFSSRYSRTSLHGRARGAGGSVGSATTSAASRIAQRSSHHHHHHHGHHNHGRLSGEVGSRNRLSASEARRQRTGGASTGFVEAKGRRNYADKWMAAGKRRVEPASSSRAKGRVTATTTPAIRKTGSGEVKRLRDDRERPSCRSKPESDEAEVEERGRQAVIVDERTPTKRGRRDVEPGAATPTAVRGEEEEEDREEGEEEEEEESADEDVIDGDECEVEESGDEDAEVEDDVGEGDEGNAGSVKQEASSESGEEDVDGEEEGDDDDDGRRGPTVGKAAGFSRPRAHRIRPDDACRQTASPSIRPGGRGAGAAGRGSRSRSASQSEQGDGAGDAKRSIRQAPTPLANASGRVKPRRCPPPPPPALTSGASGRQATRGERQVRRRSRSSERSLADDALSTQSRGPCSGSGRHASQSPAGARSESAGTPSRSAGGSSGAGGGGGGGGGGGVTAGVGGSSGAGSSARSSSSSSGGSVDERLYCVCKKVSFGDMIACDNVRCKVEWFHFACVDVRAQPKGKWYCPQCRGETPRVKRNDV